MRLPWSDDRIRLTSVVFPLPRKPVTIVTGVLLNIEESASVSRGGAPASCMVGRFSSASGGDERGGLWGTDGRESKSKGEI